MDGGIATKTLAELYLNQGNPRKALEIYREVLKRQPSNTEIREAIRTLKRKMDHGFQPGTADCFGDLTRMEKIKILEKWQENIRIIREQRKSGETR